MRIFQNLNGKIACERKYDNPALTDNPVLTEERFQLGYQYGSKPYLCFVRVCVTARVVVVHAKQKE